MLNFFVFVNSSRTDLKRTVLRSLLLGGLSAVGILSGWVPSLSIQSTPTLAFSTSAYAQGNDEVRTFARIIWEWEPRRRQIVSQIENIIRSKEVPDIACNSNNQPQISGSLPANARPLAQQLCNEYSSIIQKHGMPRARFEEMARNLDGDLKRRVEQALLELQR